ncbi:hypothetical protein V3C99_001765 [Haemonchus contortus]|uniref:BHLH domain-containing protein n=2 Tax=Haemonchus TaxID=6288 RepID=A0A158QJR7_HAEPC|nr:unnamed protein product [Haemonchus placei]
MMPKSTRSPGSALRERTRLILDWDKPSSRHHPYRMRRLSCGSTCSSDSSQPSPSSVSSLPDSPHPAMRTARDVQIFERLRQVVPTISSERNAFRILVDYVSQVMELEQRLEEVEEKIDIKPQVNPAMAPWTTCGYMSNRKTSTAHNSELFPDDLAGVDVSAFKHLICSQPLRIDASLFQ